MFGWLVLKLLMILRMAGCSVVFSVYQKVNVTLPPLLLPPAQAARRRAMTAKREKAREFRRFMVSTFTGLVEIEHCRDLARDAIFLIRARHLVGVGDDKRIGVSDG